jgi:hypothetical protein
MVVKCSEIPTRVVDGCELHFSEERGTIPDFVVPPRLLSEKEFVQAFGWRILEVLELRVGVWRDPWVIQARCECAALRQNPGLRLVNANVGKELAGTGVMNLSAQAFSNALNFRLESVVRLVNYLCESLKIDQREYGQNVPDHRGIG